MSESFDPYHELLGIPPHEQPPNHYRLLGVSLFESNRQVVTNAAIQRSKFLRSLGISEYAAICQRLLNEVAAAKICLLDGKKKSAYDAALRSRLESPPVPVPRQKDERKPSPPPLPGASWSREAGGSTEQGPWLVENAPSPPPPLSPAVVPPPVGTLSPPGPTVPPSVARNESRVWTIGRAATCDIVIDGAAVSGIHCRLSRTADGRYWLEDLGSTNGTYVNRVPIAGKVSITRYDYITLGNATPLDEVIARIERLESSGASGHEDS